MGYASLFLDPSHASRDNELMSRRHEGFHKIFPPFQLGLRVSTETPLWGVFSSEALENVGSNIFAWINRH